MKERSPQSEEETAALNVLGYIPDKRLLNEIQHLDILSILKEVKNVDDAAVVLSSKLLKQRLLKYDRLSPDSLNYAGGDEKRDEERARLLDEISRCTWSLWGEIKSYHSDQRALRSAERSSQIAERSAQLAEEKRKQDYVVMFAQVIVAVTTAATAFFSIRSTTSIADEAVGELRNNLVAMRSMLTGDRVTAGSRSGEAGVPQMLRRVVPRYDSSHGYVNGLMPGEKPERPDNQRIQKAPMRPNQSPKE